VTGVSNSEGGGAGASRSVWALATSHGFAGAYAATGHSVSASVLAGTGEGGMVRDYAHHSARRRQHLEAPEEIGRRAGDRAVARANPGRIDSGPMPVVFDPRVGASLLGHLAGAISGQAITRKTSFLLDALGTRVFAPGIHIRDDPHRPHGLRSRPFDGEGLPVSPMAVIDDGMLEAWLLDSASARQLGLEPTGHAARGVGGSPGVTTSNMFLAAGAVPVSTLIADIASGIYVTELIGQGVNGVTGDYSRGAAGFRIEGGEIAGPVAEFTIAGNLKDMFLNLTPANDLEFRYGTNVPTCRVDGMTVAGG
jgi:PmbA protein